MAVTLSAEDVQKLGPSARAQIEKTAPVKAAEPTAKAAPKMPTPPPRTGASEHTQRAARFTRQAYRASGGGKAGAFSVRAFIWLFVWLGVLFYLVAHPTTLPTLVHLVFAPVNGVIAVANGASHLAPKTG